MADNIKVQTGETVAADEVSSVWFNKVKLVDGTDDGTAGIPGDATNGLYVNVKDATTLTVIDYPHHEIHEGVSFTMQTAFALDADGVKSYMLTVPNTTLNPHLSYDAEGSFGFSFDLYEGADRTGATSALVYNRDRNSATTGTLAIQTSATGGTTDGTRIVQRVTGTGTSQGKVSGGTVEATEWILKKNTKYMLKIRSSANANTISLRLNWYEHVNA